MADAICDTDSEDEIPAGWEERVTLEGRVYYANHNTATTQWEHPVTGKTKTIHGALPYGWERQISEDGTVLYIDRVSKKTTFTDPRLAFAEVQNTEREFKQKFDGNSTALEILTGRDLTGLYVIITGATSGIGFETARSLAYHGAHVVMACRNKQSGKACRAKILENRSNLKIKVMELDLGALHTVKLFTDCYKKKNWPLHYLILNAAVFGIPYSLTIDDLETTFQVNYLAHFYLTKLLWSVIMRSAPSKVVVVSCESHRCCDLNVANLKEEKLSPSNAENYCDLKAYNLSKLCNVLFSLHLNSLMHDYGVTSVSLHPGNMMYTQLRKNWWLYRVLFFMARPFAKSMQQGAATTVYCTVAPEMKNVGGLYFNNCCPCPTSAAGSDPELARLLWITSERILTKRIGRPI